MLESSGVILSYLSPTWTRSPSCSRSSTGIRSPEWTGIALRCDPSSLVHSVLHYVETLINVGILAGVGVLVQLGVLRAIGVLK